MDEVMPTLGGNVIRVEDENKHRKHICYKCGNEIPHHVTTWFGSVCLICKENESKRKAIKG